MLSKVAEAGGSEQRVRHGVGDDVGIAVPRQTALARKRHAAEDERATVVAEGVHVEAQPHPQGGRDGRTPAQQGLRHSQVVGCRDLDVPGVACDDLDPPPARLHEGGIVGGLRLAAMSQPQGRDHEGLGRLDRHERRAVQRGDHPLSGGPLDRVGRRQARDGAVRP